MTRPLRTTFAITVLFAALSLTGLGCKSPDSATLAKSKPLTLKVWRVFDDQDTFAPIIADYRKLHPNITIEYRKFRFDEYRKAILDALAQDQGPDVISLHNSWLTEWQPRLLPAPPSLSVAFRELQGSIRPELVTVVRQVPTLSPNEINKQFVGVVPSDVIIPTEQSDPKLPLTPRVYGLPLSVDTLAVYYNRDLLNAAGIATPATEWKDFQTQVTKLTKLDATGAIVQSAAALGTAKNINRAGDILALLMMQNGTVMTDTKGMATFDRYPPGFANSSQTVPPGASALTFYTDFANPEKEVYTWNEKMPNSLTAFENGQTAYYFGYAFDLPIITAAAPKLNFGISTFPQIGGNTPVYFANYWVETVAKKTKTPDEAWDFVQFAASAAEAQKYLAVAKKPAALKSLLKAQSDDIQLSPFAAQVTNAKSWYHGGDAPATEQIMLDMISALVIAPDTDVKRLISVTAAKVNQTVK